MIRALSLIMLALGISLSPVRADESSPMRDWWLTPEQQGQRAFERGEYKQAASLFRDPMRIGGAWYRAAEFDMASAAFARVNTAEGAYNQGTALILQGLYAAAVEALDRALVARPGWPEAKVNRDIAQARLERQQASAEQGGKATEIGADEVVFDLKKSDAKNQDEIEIDSEGGMSDQELRALWLKNSQTSPAVFLKAKFAAQLAYQSEAAAEQ